MTAPLDLSLYLVTDTVQCGARGVVPTVAEALRGGVTAVQLRDPDATGRELHTLAVALRELLTGTGVPLLVNDRLDVALAAGADGVHLGQGDLPVTPARRLAPPGFLVGLSVSTVAETAEVAALPEGTVDYLGVGPVHATATKPHAPPALGLEQTARVRASTALPCVAIGGIDASIAEAVRRTGVDGLAVVSAVCGAEDPAAAARALLVGAQPGGPT